MRLEANSLIDEFGINVLYIRNCKFVRCRCFDDLHKSGDANCKLCMGTGHFASIEKVQAIESSISAYSGSNSIFQMPIGITDQKNEVYYIRHNVTPKERDYLLKVTWDKNGNPVDIVKVLEIVNVYEMRGDKGRVELTGCVIEDKTTMVRPFTQMLKSLPQKARVELAKGGKSIWPNNLLRK
jgi:hypothetical protein